MPNDIVAFATPHFYWLVGVTFLLGVVATATLIGVIMPKGNPGGYSQPVRKTKKKPVKKGK